MSVAYRHGDWLPRPGDERNRAQILQSCPPSLITSDNPCIEGDVAYDLIKCIGHRRRKDLPWFRPPLTVVWRRCKAFVTAGKTGPSGAPSLVKAHVRDS